MLAEHLMEMRSKKGAFIFVLSDFLDETLLDEQIWEHLTGMGYDPIPVILQDMRWERTFPESASGLILPFRNPATGEIEDRRYSKGSARTQRYENEQRFERIRATFSRLRMDWVELTENNPYAINEEFKRWAAARKSGASR